MRGTSVAGRTGERADKTETYRIVTYIGSYTKITKQKINSLSNISKQEYKECNLAIFYEILEREKNKDT